MEQHPERTKTPAFLADLGKPTLRGIKKCPKCGTFNGTRGLSCKNISCGAVFRDAARKPPPSAEAVRVVTGSTLQIYSVRLRDRGPDYRGFAELCPIEGVGATDGLITGRCFVPSCFKGSPHTASDSQCKHIKLATQCQAQATPHTLKSSVLNLLQVPAETKQAIWTLATESSGPLVQRITKNIMVVKCKASLKHSLGFLHVAFHDKSRTKGTTEHKFYCSCQASRTGRGCPSAQEPPRRCLHFYACICAFASDEKLGQEFSHFVNFDSTDRCRNAATPQPSVDRHLLAIYPQEQPPTNPGPRAKRKRKEEAAASSPLLTLQDSTSNKFRKTANKKQSVASAVKRPAGNQPMEEAHVTLTFQAWLASVSERINQTMHYQFDGKPEPLVFHVPQVFFDCLQQRISLGSRKKRLPNSTTGFVRKDALPLGTFSKYTWQITNVLQVKQIFDTPEMPLEVTRSFTENRDGTYQLFKCPKVQVESIAEAYTKPPAIRPLELKTFLKVGNISAEQKEPTPFIIEWIPDILPKSKIGEMRIKFEFGHHRHLYIEYRDQATAPT